MIEDAILELKTIDTEVKLLMKQHEDMLGNYTTSIRSNDIAKRGEYYNKLLDINQDIDILLNRTKKAERRINQKHGNIDTSQFLTNDISEIGKKMKESDENVRKLELNLKNIKGVNAGTAIETRSQWAKYVMVCLLMVIVIILTIRAFAYEPSTIDTIFLVSAIFLGVFHFFNKQV